jgi:ribosomal protein S18 acetylase RimI-like enzyme
MESRPEDGRHLTAVAGIHESVTTPQPVAGSAVDWQPQAFESEFLKLNSARITAFRGDDPAATLRQAFDDLARLGYDFVSLRVPATAEIQVSALREVGAREIERLVTFGCPLDGVALHMPDGIEVATHQDAEGCAEVGRQAFRNDRFHQDPELDGAGADALKAAWMRNACLGRADRVLVARAGRRILGANACIRNGDDAVIDLIGVLPEAQGRGLGRRLVDAALASYAGTAARMVVGTQATNTASVALYRSAGFLPVDEKITFHAHLR